jgi:hypothetical protein
MKVQVNKRSELNGTRKLLFYADDTGLLDESINIVLKGNKCQFMSRH